MMLFKGGSDIALEAGVFVDDRALLTVEPAISPDMIAAQQALAEAETEIAALRARIQELERDGPLEVARARDSARREAEAQCVRDDTARTTALEAGLAGARETFVTELRGASEGLAVRLAQAALRSLVEASATDDAWLVRFINHRLAGVEADGVIAIALPETCRDLSDQITAPAGATVTFDALLKPGHARIELTMGGIPIQIGEGLKRILSVLDAEQGRDG